jgi:hypothetical protein
MKKLLLIITLAVVSCKKSDNSTPAPYASLYGIAWMQDWNNLSYQGGNLNSLMITEDTLIFFGAGPTFRLKYTKVKGDSIYIPETPQLDSMLKQISGGSIFNVSGGNVIRAFFNSDSLLIYGHRIMLYDSVNFPLKYYRQ